MWKFTAVPVVLSGSSFRAITIETSAAPGIPPTRWQKMRRQAAVQLSVGIDTLRNILLTVSTAPGWQDFIMAPRYRQGLSWLIVLPISLLKWIPRLAQLILGRPTARETDNSISTNLGDILLLADSTWSQADVWPAVKKFREQGGRVVMIIYDLIPLTHPEYCNGSVISAYGRWIRDSIRHVDFYACISHHTELELQKHLQTIPELPPQRPLPATCYFHLGSDLDLTRSLQDPSPEVRALSATPAPTFLVVGSLEPRKNLPFILDAFDLVWERCDQVQLVIVGHNAWKSDQLLDRIQRHPRRGTNLVWLRNASDDDLEHLYQTAAALVFASVIEGFGLPIVEAMQRGLPVICSDISVLREIADGKAEFFSLDAPENLAQAVVSAITQRDSIQRIHHPWLSWEKSTENLLQLIGKQLLPGHGNSTGLPY